MGFERFPVQSAFTGTDHGLPVLTESGYVHRSEDVGYRIQLSLPLFGRIDKRLGLPRCSRPPLKESIPRSECYTATEGSNYGKTRG